MNATAAIVRAGLSAPRRAGSSTRRTALTLLELLVVMAILGVLLTIVASGIAQVRSEARTLICLNSMRSTTLVFRLFADPYAHPHRGDSSEQFGQRFSAWDFQESLYRVSEFQSGRQVEAGAYRYRPAADAVVCASAPGPLARASPGQALATNLAVAPSENVSYAMNRRLLYAPFEQGTFQSARFVAISERVLDHPFVPLMFDVDAGRSAPRTADMTFFSAPAGKTPSIYDGTPARPEPYWYPAKRHRGRMVIGFVGGHAVAAKNPFADPSWDWEYHPSLDP